MSPFTEKQATVVMALVRGHSMPSAANELGMKLSSVAYLTEAAKRRVGVETIGELARVAVESGIVSDGEVDWDGIGYRSKNKHARV